MEQQLFHYFLSVKVSDYSLMNSLVLSQTSRRTKIDIKGDCKNENDKKLPIHLGISSFTSRFFVSILNVFSKFETDYSKGKYSSK